MRPVACGVRLGMGLVLVLSLGGCEALQRKLTRKPKHPAERPTPVIQFRDYTHAMTPLERYQKHYMLFDYWNAQLLAAFEDDPPSGKRLRHTSAEALKELETMHSLLRGPATEAFAPIVEDRRAMDRQVQRGSVRGVAGTRLWHALDRQTRQVQSQFDWRDVQDQLQPTEGGPANGGLGAAPAH